MSIQRFTEQPGVQASFFEDEIAVTPSGDTGGVAVLMGCRTRINALVSNSGADALDGFLVEAQFHPDGPWVTYISGTELAAETPLPGRLLGVSDDLTTLAGSASATVLIDVTALYALRFVATTGSGDATTVEISAGVA